MGRKTLAVKPSTWRDLKRRSVDCEVSMGVLLDRLVGLANRMPVRYLTSTKDWEEVFTETFVEWLRLSPSEFFIRLLTVEELESLLRRVREALEKAKLEASSA